MANTTPQEAFDKALKVLSQWGNEWTLTDQTTSRSYIFFDLQESSKLPFDEVQDDETIIDFLNRTFKPLGWKVEFYDENIMDEIEKVTLIYIN